MAFTPRLNAPTRTLAFYLCTPAIQIAKYGSVRNYGGVNECIIGNNSQDGSALPNCVGYAWGRWYEILGARPNLSRGNANEWYSYNDGYTHRTTSPTLGSVCCFSTQHVNIIEQKISDTEYVTSGSYWGTTGSSADFVLEKLKYINGTWKRCNYNTGNPFGEAYQGFQGFIILPISDPDNVLTNIDVTGIEMNFQPDVLEYSYTTYLNYTALTVTPKYQDQVITRYINGIVVLDSQVAYLNEGENTLFVFSRRTIEGVNYITQYKITLYYGVIPPPTERDPNIANVSIAGTDFENTFSEFNYNYNYDLEGESNRLVIVANDDESVITVTLNGVQIARRTGIVTAVVDWNAGVNYLTIDSVVIDTSTEQPEVYQAHYYITINSKTNIDLLLFNFYKDSAKTQQVPTVPAFETNIVDYNVTLNKIFKLYFNYLLADSRAWISVYVNGTLYVGAQYTGIDLKNGKNTVKVYASGYSYDGSTVVFNTYTFIIYVKYFKIIYSTRIW